MNIKQLIIGLITIIIDLILLFSPIQSTKIVKTSYVPLGKIPTYSVNDWTTTIGLMVGILLIGGLLMIYFKDKDD